MPGTKLNYCIVCIAFNCFIDAVKSCSQWRIIAVNCCGFRCNLLPTHNPVAPASDTTLVLSLSAPKRSNIQRRNTEIKKYVIFFIAVCIKIVNIHFLHHCNKIIVPICNPVIFVFYLLGVKCCFHLWNDQVKAIQHTFNMKNGHDT